jgi:hypothetical protein
LIQSRHNPGCERPLVFLFSGDCINSTPVNFLVKMNRHFEEKGITGQQTKKASYGCLFVTLTLLL